MGCCRENFCRSSLHVGGPGAQDLVIKVAQKILAMSLHVGGPGAQSGDHTHDVGPQAPEIATCAVIMSDWRPLCPAK